jgi:hypothetical protein
VFLRTTTPGYVAKTKLHGQDRASLIRDSLLDYRLGDALIECAAEDDPPTAPSLWYRFAALTLAGQNDEANQCVPKIESACRHTGDSPRMRDLSNAIVKSVHVVLRIQQAPSPQFDRTPLFKELEQQAHGMPHAKDRHFHSFLAESLCSLPPTNRTSKGK